MDETVFFNLGNKIASNFDPKELQRQAQIYQENNQPKDHLIVVTDPESGELFLFDTSDKVGESDHSGKVFNVKEHL